jgi:aminoglycoside phosphotransferase (APT) family kinase protein
VHRLPLGLYAKRIPDWPSTNEPDMLRFLERHAPSIPAPCLIDTFQTDEPEAENGWFIMTALPGVRVYDVLYRMSYAERDQLADDLRSILNRMHQIQNKNPYLFSSVSGGRIHDQRAAAPGGCGPYNSEADLNSQLAKPFEKYPREAIPNAFSRTHRSVFSHSDLFLSNVLVDGGRLSGIVDWEQSAFMPEYWDFTKAMVASRRDTDAVAIYRRIWGYQFDEELEVMRWVHDVSPFGGAEAD